MCHEEDILFDEDVPVVDENTLDQILEGDYGNGWCKLSKKPHILKTKFYILSFFLNR